MRTFLALIMVVGVALVAFPSHSAAASDAGFLYGKVTTVDGTTYTGEIRWGKEETFWDDIFNSTKEENPNIDYLDDDELREVRRHGRDKRWWEHIVVVNNGRHTHAFSVRFGDIKSIEIHRSDEVEVTFKNGVSMDFEGGSNDIGAKITVVDEELGLVKLKWKRVEMVEFMPTPSTLEPKLGEPLSGTVETRSGTYEGLIQWDHEECLTSDILDGDTEDGDVSIRFEKIAAIEKHRRGSIVTLKSGRELYLTGSNDVNRENRGVVVKDPEYGKMKIEWSEFENVTFDNNAATSGDGYDTYAAPRELHGVVRTEDGDTYSGRIVYDLDEEWDFEILDGSDGKIVYKIPFRVIARIVPEGRKSATIELRSGKTLRLSKSQDVSRDNDGVLVFTDSRDPKYIPWNDIEEIHLN